MPDETTESWQAKRQRVVSAQNQRARQTQYRSPEQQIARAETRKAGGYADISDPYDRAYAERHDALIRVLHGQDQDAKMRARQELEQMKQMRTKMGLFEAGQEESREGLLRGFREFSEAGVGRGIGSILRQQELGAQRRGIAFSGLASRGAAEAQAGLQGQALGMQQKFATQLGQLQEQNRVAMMRGEFDFMNRMSEMMMSQQFERQMMEMQAQMQQDAQSRNAILGLAGSVGGFLAGGPIGGAIGSRLAGWIGGGGGITEPGYL